MRRRLLIALPFAIAALDLLASGAALAQAAATPPVDPRTAEDQRRQLLSRRRRRQQSEKQAESDRRLTTSDDAPPAPTPGRKPHRATGAHRVAHDLGVKPRKHPISIKAGAPPATPPEN